MRLDVTNLSYDQIEALVLSLPMAAKEITQRGNRILLEVESVAF